MVTAERDDVISGYADDGDGGIDYNYYSPTESWAMQGDDKDEVAETPTTTTRYGIAQLGLWYSTVHAYVALAVCAWGVAANLANIIVLTRPSMITATNVILTWLAVADLLTMSFYIPFLVHFYLTRDTRLNFPSTRSFVWIRYNA